MIASDMGDVVVIGSAYSPGILQARAFLTRNGHPFHDVDFDPDQRAQHCLDRFHVDVPGMPAVICRGHAVLRNPTHARIAA